MADHPSLLPSELPDDQAELSVLSASTERVEALLLHGEIVRTTGTMLWGSNYSALLTVRDADLRAAAVYKPRRGERPLWDFPRGSLCNREVAAYRVARALQWQIVPPTVLREGPQGVGSLQLFIQHDPQMHYFNLPDSFVDQLQRFALFDFVVNNTDRKGGHLLLDPAGHLWGIDHGLTFHVDLKLRTVIWEFAGEPIAEPLLASVHQLCEQLRDATSSIRLDLTALLSAREVEALLQRVERVLLTKTFPFPGPGPSHPWPPV